MTELGKRPEVSETNPPAIENFKEIKPQEGTTHKEARAFWDEQFKNSESPSDEVSKDVVKDVSDHASNEGQTKQPQECKENLGRHLEIPKPNDGLTDAEKEKIKAETGWSDEIVNHIDSMEQYDKIYKNADLHEAEVDGRKCLIKHIDLDYVDLKTGLTNRDLMANGRSPIDAKTGEKIELHHMGQSFDGPFAELCENSEHGDGNHETLHPKSEGSWRKDLEKKSQYNTEKKEHWKARSMED